MSSPRWLVLSAQSTTGLERGQKTHSIPMSNFRDYIMVSAEFAGNNNMVMF